MIGQIKECTCCLDRRWINDLEWWMLDGGRMNDIYFISHHPSACLFICHDRWWLRENNEKERREKGGNRKECLKYGCKGWIDEGWISDWNTPEATDSPCTASTPAERETHTLPSTLTNNDTDKQSRKSFKRRHFPGFPDAARVATQRCVNHRAPSCTLADRRCQDSKSLPLLYK